MKIFGILTVLLIALVIGGVAYIATSDVPVTQTVIVHDLSAGQLK